MDWQFFTSVALFAVVMTGTPGPNNVMLTASGANFGYRRTVPHFVGIGTGLLSQMILIAAGLGVVFERYPEVQQVLRIASSAYLLYLAWRIGTAMPPEKSNDNDSKPMTLFEAALFQYLNPKAWIMSLTAVGSFSFTGDQFWWSVIAMGMIFWLVQLHTSSVWVGFGTLIRRWLSSVTAWRRFNVVMGLLTASCVVFIW
ncbi:lysine transporter LysE [Vibrio nigripulchritudo]|uniref:LysE family translocator n=1 Tax=Vibrio nigripulchritudo TaxID=28173 RepID=UPI001909A09B|nr:LysE family translocator [Vibrio nigripulchritudo]BCL68345.1 lysine transporter LysE [Vibrio nigripulchritudo]BDU29673.1 lysine transporter LysE [Vibrio nigripulchritudo]